MAARAITRVKFLDLQKINALYADELRQATERVIRSGQYVLGEELKSFEKKFAQYCGASHCLGVANGLDALTLIWEAYKVLGIMEQ